MVSSTPFSLLLLRLDAQPVFREQSATMLFESAHVRVTAESGTATLWLGYPGRPANALDVPRLRQLDNALQAVAARPSVRVLVVRSAIASGFCEGIRPEVAAGLTHPTDRAAFAWYGQQVFDRLAQLDVVTLAHLEGSCLGVGLELALACDYRLCVAHPGVHVGFPERFTCFGGSGRLRNLIGRRADQLLTSGHTLSGREARALGLIDVACCPRRTRIELRTFLDRIERRPIKPRPPAGSDGCAAERRAFAAFPPRAIERSPETSPLNPLPPLPEVVGLLGDDPDATRLATEIALRGGNVVVCGNRAGAFAGIEHARKRGFVTPLEAEQTRLRVRSSDNLAGFDRAGLVFVSRGHNPFRLAAVVRPRAVVCVIRPPGAEPLAATDPPDVPFPFVRRVVQISFCEGNRIAVFPSRSSDVDTPATLAAWFQPFGCKVVAFPTHARLLLQAA